MSSAIVMVAHPDDCVIFAWSLMHHYPRLQWTICYLTYTAESSRGKELRSFWNQRRIPTQFLGFEDDYHDLEDNTLHHWTQDQVNQACWDACSQADLVLTHDANGDYGHIHHRAVHHALQVARLNFSYPHPRVITFAPPGHGTHDYELPAGLWHDNELPEHAKIVRSFHNKQHKNSYLMDQTTHRWLEAWR